MHVVELTRAQATRGHAVTLLFRAGDGSALPVTTRQLTLPGPLEALQGLAGTALFSARAAWMTRPSEYDIIHAHGDVSEAFLLHLRARRFHVPLVLTVHGALNPRIRRLSHYLYRGVDAFIALGERVRSDLLACGVDDRRIAVMSSGLNMPMLQQARGAKPEPGLIVTVGSLDPVKNIDVIIKAVLALPSSSGTHLEIIGSGPERDRLEALAAGSRRIRFSGQMARQEVYNRVAAADTFVIASRRLVEKGEGIPTALLEAMGLSKACIVSDHATPEPVVSDSASYLRFNPDDVEMLAQSILDLVLNDESRIRLGDRAFAAVSQLGWDDVAGRVDDVYGMAMSSFGTQP